MTDQKDRAQIGVIGVRVPHNLFDALDTLPVGCEMCCNVGRVVTRWLCARYIHAGHAFLNDMESVGDQVEPKPVQLRAECRTHGVTPLINLSLIDDH